MAPQTSINGNKSNVQPRSPGLTSLKGLDRRLQICYPLVGNKMQTPKQRLLEYIAGQQIVVPFMLCDAFGWSLNYARKRLSLLKKQGLVEYFPGGIKWERNWCLTSKGDERLYYLQRNTERQEVEKGEAEEKAEELSRLRKRVEKLESHPWIIYEELAPISKELRSILRPMVIIETRRLSHDVLPYRRKFYRLLGEAKRIIERLPEEERPKVEALLFKARELRLFFLAKAGLSLM